MMRWTLRTLVIIGMILPSLADAGDDSIDHAAAILSAYNKWAETTNAKDIDQWSTFLAPEAVFFPSDGPALDSNEAIVSYYLKLFDDPNFTLDCAQSFIEVFESNDVAWARGTCKATFSLPDGRVGRGSSKWAKIWVRLESGEWKCRLNTWNNN